MSSLESPIKFVQRFKVISVPFFCSWLHLKYNIKSFYIDIILRQNEFSTLAQFLVKKSKMVSLASSKMKNVKVFSARSRFLLKIVCCIAFGSASNACCLLKSITIIL